MKIQYIFFLNFFFGGILLLFGGWCREVVYLDWAVDKHRITCGVARLGFLNPFLNLDHLEWFPAVNSGGEGWSGWPMDVANFSSEVQKNHFVQKLKIHRDKAEMLPNWKLTKIERLVRRKFKKTRKYIFFCIYFFF